MVNRTDGFRVITSFTRGLFILVLLVYISYSVGWSIYRNYTINQEINQLKNDIAKLHGDIGDLQNLIVYYQSDSFKEVEARRRLGLRAPGEQVVILPKIDQQKVVSDQSQTPDNSTDQADFTPNPVKWYKFVMNKN